MMLLPIVLAAFTLTVCWLREAALPLGILVATIGVLIAYCGIWNIAKIFR